MASIERRGLKWRARVRQLGQRPISKTFPTQKAAEEWSRTVEAHLDMCRPNTVRNAATRFADLLVRYEVEVVPLKRGARQDMSRVAKWLKHPLGKLPVNDLQASHFARYRDERLREGASPNTVRLELALASHLFNVARGEWGFEDLTNPVAPIRKPAAGAGRDRRITGQEENLLLSIAYARDGKWLGDAIVLAIETAMRRGELLALRWADTSLERRVARLHSTKNGERRDVPLSPRALSVLKAMERPSERVLPISANALRLAFDRARAKAGMPDLRFHDLRHEAASRLFERGLNQMEVATITGHKSMQMLKRYTHLRAEDLAAKL